MSTGFLKQLSATFILFLCLFSVKAQATYTFEISSKSEDCTKGAAGIQVAGTTATDVVTYNWSTGQTGVTSISNLDAGDYNVQININGTLDTTIAVKVEKDKCKVAMSNHFTPNSDAYNDTWSVGNTHYYPKFELYVFNKWGQQVYSQRGKYEPWDGKWNGVNVPDGTYYYVFYYDGGNKRDLEKGDVTILR
ncbi:MAG: hypothetical protein K0S32_4204 [Bacteroidetes bacterium]|jgi:gliding motility-associated-like protein|nr:hypothetical protein [Bacteroidota bacterium]